MRTRRLWSLVFGIALCSAAVCALAAAPGEPAPAFALSTADGRTIALDELRGRVVYLDFWASWCGPCRRSFPWMNEIQQRYARKGLTSSRSTSTPSARTPSVFCTDTRRSSPCVYDASGTTPARYDVKAHAELLSRSTARKDRVRRAGIPRREAATRSSKRSARKWVTLMPREDDRKARCALHRANDTDPDRDRRFRLRDDGPPQPWEKGNLARPEMQFDSDPLDTKITQHIYTSKEAATGGYGAGGGGCGCN